jgi:hypothetical protein
VTSATSHCPSSMIRRSLLASLVALASACAHAGGPGNFPSSAITRPAVDVPEQFTLGASAGAPSSDGTCRSPLTDPRTGFELRFVRTMTGIGDYEVPTGRYGARGGELLRIDCRTMKAIGLVPR